ncbi:MAG: hypothetical protein U9N77_16120 [Thermodesulfobacteriota bacterium]|nr:hypothetical protein [Thermodesulfobacteriota bacterium]
MKSISPDNRHGRSVVFASATTNNESHAVAVRWKDFHINRHGRSVVFASLILMILFLMMLPGNLFAASCGNFLESFSEKKDDTICFVKIMTDTQENYFATQRDRVSEPGSDGTNRHYAEARSSALKTLYHGIKAGIALKKFPVLYLTAGYAKTDVDFSFSDKNTEHFHSYSKDTSFESDYFLVFGGGVSAEIFKKEVLKDKTVTAGVDLQYRLFDFDAKKRVETESTGAYDMDYSSTLHEVQLALACSLKNISWNPFSKITLLFAPYGGCKISYITGDEKYDDPGNVYGSSTAYFHDPVSYAGDIEDSNHISWFAGTSVKISESIMMNLETRSGDEDGYTLSFTYKF